MLTIEEGAIGGLGAHVLTLASDEGLLDMGLKIRTLRLPDTFQDHDAPDKQYDDRRAQRPADRRLRAESAALERCGGGRGG